MKIDVPETKHINVQRLAFNRTELALSLGVSTNSVDLMVKEGFLPPARRWHTRKLWIVAEVQAHLSGWPVAGSAEDHASEMSWGLNELVDSTDWRATRTAEKPMNQRERKALSELAASEDGVWVHRSKVHCGIDTRERLEERGFIQLRPQTKFPDRVDSFMLTAEGRKAARNLVR